MADTQGIMSKFKLNSHHKIERFGITFGILSIAMVMVIVSCLISQMKQNVTHMTEAAVYSTEFVTSRTGQKGQVVNVFTNESKTKAFVLLKFNDMSKMSRDANNYESFLTGVNTKMKQTKLQSAPSGSIYVFGSTGYMGIYMVDNGGFPKQILDLTVRCDKEIAEVDETSIETEYDNSFIKYDQFKVYFNPGGTEAALLSCLDDANPSVYDLYVQSVIEPQEQELREMLDADIKALQSDLKYIDETAERLGLIDVQVPALSREIAGDKVETVGEGEDAHLEYKPATIVSSGYDYDWRAGSVRTGYLDNLIGNQKLTYSQYFTKKASEGKGELVLPDETDWVKVDGSPIPQNADEAVSESVYTNMMNDINDYMTALNTYYDHKTTYQCEDLKTLLSLEAEAKSINNGSTINTSEYSLVLW